MTEIEGLQFEIKRLSGKCAEWINAHTELESINQQLISENKKLKLYSQMVFDTIDELQSDLSVYKGILNGDNK